METLAALTVRLDAAEVENRIAAIYAFEDAIAAEDAIAVAEAEPEQLFGCLRDRLADEMAV